MALIKCPECAKEISDRAASCPNCGALLPGLAVTQTPTALIAAPEPAVGACYSHSWKILWDNFGILLGIFLIAMIINSPGWVKLVPAPLRFIYAVLVGWPLGFGLCYSWLRTTREQNVEIKDLFCAFQDYGNVLLANLLMGLIILGGFILLIVPGIIFACRLAFVPYLVVDKKMRAMDAVRKSWNMTKGYANKVFLIWLLGIPVAIAGLICLVVGAIPAIMWVSLAAASLYFSVNAKKNQTQPPQNQTN